MKRRRRLTLFISLLPFLACSATPLHAGSDVALSEAGGALAKVLVAAVLHDPISVRKIVAAKQLRRMMRAGQIDIGVLRPLTGQWDSIVEDAIACDALAVGGREIEGNLLDGVKNGRLCLLQALAQIQDPSAEATAELVSLAKQEESYYGKSMYALALAARGDMSRDWTQDLVGYLASRAPYVEEAKRWRFWEALCYVAPRFSGSKAIDDGLWEAATDARNNYGKYEAFMAFASMGRRPVDAARINHLRTEMRYEGGEEDVALQRALVCVVLARLGFEPKSEMEEACALVGSWYAMGGEQYVALVSICDVLIGDDLAEMLSKALSSGSKVVTIGAIRFAVAMGPDALNMLGELDKLALDSDEQIARGAHAARVFVAGLGPDGQSVLHEDWETF